MGRTTMSAASMMEVIAAWVRGSSVAIVMVTGANAITMACDSADHWVQK